MWILRTWRKFKAGPYIIYMHKHNKKYYCCNIDNRCRKCGVLAPQNIKIETFKGAHLPPGGDNDD